MASEYPELERKVGNFFLSELISFMRVDAMGPLDAQNMNQAYLTRAVYASSFNPGSTAQDQNDPVAFASKMQKCTWCWRGVPYEEDCNRDRGL